MPPQDRDLRRLRSPLAEVNYRRMSKILYALACLALLPQLAPALPAQPDGESEVSATTLVEENSVPLSSGEKAALMLSQGDDRIVIGPALIILAGAKAWSVIVNGRPSADLASAYASAIPGFQFNWADLSEWRKTTRRYRFLMGNAIQGQDAVDITYEASFFHGPLPQPGPGPLRKGHYITNFVIKPLDIKMKWGWKVSLSVLMSNPMNTGTAAEPVATLMADLKWLFAKPFSDEPKIGMDSMTVDGLGGLQTSVAGSLEIPVPDGGRDLPPPAAVRWD